MRSFIAALLAALMLQGSTIDTHYIQEWCGNGNVTMVAAHLYEVQEDGTITLEDETGNLWDFTDIEVNETDFLLLWIDGTDVVKLWKEI